MKVVDPYIIWLSEYGMFVNLDIVAHFRVNPASLTLYTCGAIAGHSVITVNSDVDADKIRKWIEERRV
jgi:hypothetical protein